MVDHLVLDGRAAPHQMYRRVSGKKESKMFSIISFLFFGHSVYQKYCFRVNSSNLLKTFRLSFTKFYREVSKS